MVMKKIAFGTLLLACPWMVFADAAQQRSPAQQQQQQQVVRGTESIDEVRRQCEEVRNNPQMKDFEIKYECLGESTFWEARKGFISLSNEGGMHTQTSTKDNRFPTQPSRSSSARSAHPVSCNVYTQKELSTPVSLILSVSDCEDLTVANLHRLCKQEVEDYCDSNVVDVGNAAQSQTQTQQRQQQQQSNDGRCVIRTVDVIDTCRGYN